MSKHHGSRHAKRGKKKFEVATPTIVSPPTAGDGSELPSTPSNVDTGGDHHGGGDGGDN